MHGCMYAIYIQQCQKDCVKLQSNAMIRNKIVTLEKSGMNEFGILDAKLQHTVIFHRIIDLNDDF